MKRITTIILVLTMVLLSATASFAAEPTERDDSVATPMYVGTSSHSALFTISSTGLSKMSVSLSPFTTTTFDKVTVNLSIKNSSGTSVYNKTFSMPWSSIYARFKLEKEYQLSKKGTYEFQATYKCYKNNTLIETIKSGKQLKSY